MQQTYGALPVPRMTKDLLELMKDGNVWDLGTERSDAMPLWPGHPPFRVMPYKWHGETQDVTPPGTLYNEMVVTCMHAGSHIDALNHIGEICDGKVILGKDTDANDAREWWGSNWADGAKFHPIILRAVVLDMLKYKGGEDTGGHTTVARKYGITVEDIKGCMEAQGIEARTDIPTAFLVRTGMMKYFKSGMDNFGGDAAGPNLEAEKYLHSIGGVLTGSDTVSYEQMIVGEHPVHRYAMQNGIIIAEVLDLEEVCEAGITEGVLIALPLKLRGTSGSLVDPIIIT